MPSSLTLSFSCGGDTTCSMQGGIAAYVRSDAVREALTTLVLLVAYMLIGSLVMGFGQGLSADESVYFLMVSMSTVGYGDISPNTPVLKAFMIVWILVGIVVIFARISGVVVFFTQSLVTSGRDLIERLYPSVTIDIDGDGVADFKVPETALVYYAKNLLPSLTLMLLVQLIGAVGFIIVQPDWNFGDAFYHCMCTATTVG